LFCFGKAKEVEDQYRNLFGCESRTLCYKYLVIPIHFQKLKKERKHLEDRFERKLSSWIGKVLSYGDRIMLINSVLTSLLMFNFFLDTQRGLKKNLDFISFGKAMATNGSTDLPSGHHILVQG
jgi:hypothetical protein